MPAEGERVGTSGPSEAETPRNAPSLPKHARLQFRPEHGLDGLRTALLRDIFQNPVHQEWVEEVNHSWGDIAKAVTGRRSEDLDPGALSQAAASLDVQARRLQQELSREDDPDEAWRLKRKLERSAAAATHLRQVRAQLDARKQDIHQAELTRLRKELIQESSSVFDKIDALSTSPAATPKDVAHELDRLARLEQGLRDRKTNLTRIEKTLGVHDESAWGEINKRLIEVEKARKHLKSLRTKKERQHGEEAKSRAEKENARKLRQGVLVDDYDGLYRRMQDAQRVLRNSHASREERDDAKAFIQRYRENLKRLAKRADAEATLETDQRQVERLKALLPTLRGPDRERVKSLVAQSQERLRAHRRQLDETRSAETDHLPSAGTRWWRRAAQETRVSARRAGAWMDHRLEKAREPLQTVRKSTAFQGLTDTVSENARVAGYGWLWRTQARRYRRQEDNARKAQRIARSGMWEWWYVFSEPVRRTVLLSLTLAPVMVPWGIFQIAGWMALVVAAYIINFIGSSIIELASLAVYAFLSGINIVGSFVKGLADGAAHRLLGVIGQCDTPESACAYQSLDFTFGVSYPQAAPLLDPRLFFPTHFSNNSILSVVLDFLATVSPWLIILLGAVAILLWPVLLMEQQDGWKRILVGLGICLAIFPAFLTQTYLQENFYHAAAELFRTGVGRVITEPAEALARDARDAIQGATFSPFGGG